MPSTPAIPNAPDLTALISPLLPVAEYVRMSTDYQRYSIANQEAAIRSFAASHGMQIIRTYKDKGKSGLDIGGRSGLQDLLRDVQGGNADFQAILVYDVSRWGRFQNVDESAHYEYLCTHAGIKIIYCAEPFQSDNSPLDAIIKTVKRAMAAEYSRELSTKVFAGQCRLINSGYRSGGSAGFGLRRALIDHKNGVKTTLEPGEHKNLQSDRVILVPGPAHEIALVRRIYRDFIDGRMSAREIADALTSEGYRRNNNRPWTRFGVHQVLTNEKYIGNSVYNRTSAKLRQPRQQNPRDEWVRSDHAFQGIVSESLFKAANSIIQQRSRHLSDEKMLHLLKHLLDKKGKLTARLIDKQRGLPSKCCYQHRFGSLIQAYERIGYVPNHNFDYHREIRALQATQRPVVEKILQQLRHAGGDAFYDSNTEILTVNKEWTVSIFIARYVHAKSKRPRWRLHLGKKISSDFVVVVRMEEGNQVARDYYIFPRIDSRVWPTQLTEHNIPVIESYRFETLTFLADMARRTHLEEKA